MMHARRRLTKDDKRAFRILGILLLVLVAGGYLFRHQLNGALHEWLPVLATIGAAIIVMKAGEK